MIGRDQQMEAVDAEDPTSLLYTVFQVLLWPRFSLIIGTEHPFSMHMSKQPKVDSPVETFVSAGGLEVHWNAHPEQNLFSFLQREHLTDTRRALQNKATCRKLGHLGNLL